MNDFKKGFTLIELLVVIAIIALLSSVVLASLSTARAKARDARRVADIDQIRTAMNMYYDSYGAFPPCSANCQTTLDASPSRPYAGSAYSAAIPTLQQSWADLGATITPAYMAKLPSDPVNVWPYSYFYMPNGHNLCDTTASSGPLLLFSTEINTYSFQNLNSGTGGAKGRYCVPLQ